MDIRLVIIEISFKNIKTILYDIIDMMRNRMVFILFKQVTFLKPGLWWRIGGGR